MNTALKFCYEIQGFAEITNEVPTVYQWQIILKKLESVSVDALIIETDIFMAPEVFVVWIKGFVDIVSPEAISDRQWTIIKDHLQLIFTKVTPSYEDEDDNADVAKRVHNLFEGMQNSRHPFRDLNKLNLMCACENTKSLNAGDDMKAYCCTNDETSK
jgi:hypothetical protein